MQIERQLRPAEGAVVAPLERAPLDRVYVHPVEEQADACGHGGAEIVRAVDLELQLDGRLEQIGPERAGEELGTASQVAWIA